MLQKTQAFFMQPLKHNESMLSRPFELFKNYCHNFAIHYTMLDEKYTADNEKYKAQLEELKKQENPCEDTLIKLECWSNRAVHATEVHHDIVKDKIAYNTKNIIFEQDLSEDFYEYFNEYFSTEATESSNPMVQVFLDTVAEECSDDNAQEMRYDNLLHKTKCSAIYKVVRIGNQDYEFLEVSIDL